MFNDTAILIMVVLGQMTVILTRCIDLSVGANIALTGVFVSLTNAAFPEVPVPLLMLAAVGIGFALGAFNGAMVWMSASHRSSLRLARCHLSWPRFRGIRRHVELLADR